MIARWLSGLIEKIGYASCAAIASVVCEACKPCPLFVKGKSPLNISAAR
jgi:hypothetical protein